MQEIVFTTPGILPVSQQKKPRFLKPFLFGDAAPSPAHLCPLPPLPASGYTPAAERCHRPQEEAWSPLAALVKTDELLQVRLASDPPLAQSQFFLELQVPQTRLL